MGFNLGGVLGGVFGGVGGALLGNEKGRKKSDQRPGVANNMRDPASAPGSGLGPLGAHFLPGFEAGTGPTGIYGDILNNYEGKWEWLQHMQDAGRPFMAASLGTTPAARHMEDFKNVENPMQAFGQGSGMIGTGAANSLQGAQNQMRSEEHTSELQSR